LHPGEKKIRFQYNPKKIIELRCKFRHYEVRTTCSTTSIAIEEATTISSAATTTLKAKTMVSATTIASTTTTAKAISAATTTIASTTALTIASISQHQYQLQQ
jgi:hypothetical protein